jgi:hypothetical protein
LVDPSAEREVGESAYRFEGGDTEIVAEVRHQMAVESGEVIEVDSDSEAEDEGEADVGKAEMIRLCQQLEGLCIKYGATDSSLDLSRQLRRFRAYLRQEELKNASQKTLDVFWKLS